MLEGGLENGFLAARSAQSIARRSRSGDRQERTMSEEQVALEELAVELDRVTAQRDRLRKLILELEGERWDVNEYGIPKRTAPEIESDEAIQPGDMTD